MKSRAKISQVKKGTKLLTDGGFLCVGDKQVVNVHQDREGLFFNCAEGKHYLDGQTKGEYYVGLSVIYYRYQRRVRWWIARLVGVPIDLAYYREAYYLFGSVYVITF